jgi:hypothetical protein
VAGSAVLPKLALWMRRIAAPHGFSAIAVQSNDHVLVIEMI